MNYWEENGLEKPQQVVVCAACKHPTSDLMICGARHWDSVMREQFMAMAMYGEKQQAAQWEQGFIDQFGDFLTREEAAIVARKSGQTKCEGKIIFSEDLY